MERVYDTRTVRRGTQTRPLPTAASSLGEVQYGFDAERYTLDEFFARRQTTGMLVLHDGTVAIERYALENDADSVVTFHSVSKSVTATLAGCALADGAFESIDEPIAGHLPQLRNTVFDGVTLRHLLSMTSGVRWSIDRGDSESELSRYDSAVNGARAGVLMNFMGSLKRIAAPGTRFCYSSGDSYLIGAAVAAAVQCTLSEYLSRKIWIPAGMQADAHFGLDSPDGIELGGHGLSATLRDLARFGLFVLDDGCVDGTRNLPEGWLQAASHPSQAAGPCGYGVADPDPGFGYGYQWWSLPAPGRRDRHPEGAFTGWGLFGQWLYINPVRRLVVALSGTWPTPRDPAAVRETLALIAAVEAMLP
jgi:CubicO group peptidase (beta-lactamase class C family)